MSRHRLALVLLLGGLLTFSLTAFTARERVITITVEEVSLHYREEVLWDEERFTHEYKEYTSDKRGYVTDLAAATATGWGSYGVTVGEWQLSFWENYTLETDKATYSTFFECFVKGAVSKRGTNYTARFQWLLTPLGLDFIDDSFVPSKTGLSWEGERNGIPTTIMVKAPTQEADYTAWHHPNGHCHAHVWWTKKGG